MKLKDTNSNNVSHRYISLYPKEFTLAVNGNLHCLVCCKEINPNKKFIVDQHRLTKKHKKGIYPKNQNGDQVFFAPKKDVFTEKLISAFSSADIPLYKMDNKELKELFNYMNHPLPSRTTIRNQLLLKSGPDMKTKIKSDYSNKKIFLVVDERTINNKQCLNILCGDINFPQKFFVLSCKILSESPNSELIVQSIIESFAEYNFDLNNFVLLMSDAAAYMMKAAKILKQAHKNLFHITCLAHLAHNCAMKIKAKYSDVDDLVASMKMLTIKNKTNKLIFKSVGPIPSVIVTRWSSWLKAACFYAENLHKIRDLFPLVKMEGIIATRAKTSVFCDTLYESLVEIKITYERLILFLEELENGKYNLKTGYLRILKLFEEEELNLKDYIKTRLRKCDYEKIITYENQEIPASEYAKIIYSPCTSISVERSFSMLKRMLRVERDFNETNIETYFMLYYNSNILKNGENIKMDGEEETPDIE